MAGFDNDVVYGTNINLSLAGATGGNASLVTDGQMLIASTVLNGGGSHVNVGMITSPDGSLAIGFSTPNITLQVDGGTTTGKTITGNTGGALSPAAGNWNIVTANSTPIFAGSGSTLTQDFNLQNLVLGSSLPALTNGTSNVGMGPGVMAALTSGTNNVGIGVLSTQNINSGASNTFVGYGSGRSLTSGNSNTYIGAGSGTGTTTGVGNTALGLSSLALYTAGTTNLGSNVAIGNAALGNVATGIFNIAIGAGTATSYTTSESSNITISASGTVGESNVIRIGTQGSGNGQQNKCFIGGINGNTVSNAEFVTIDTVTGQLGTTPGGGGGAATAFYAFCSTDKTNVTGNSVIYQVIFDSTQRNDGTAYNTATGEFTAPNTGMYSFVANIALTGLDATSTSILIFMNGSTFDQFTYSVGAGCVNASGNYFSSASWIIPMTAGDKVTISVFSNKTTQTVSVAGGAFGTNISSSFAGYFIGT